jgi:DNA-binding beta-propeller fold protein YncE
MTDLGSSGKIGLRGRLHVALAAGVVAGVFALGASAAQASTPGQLTQLGTPLGCITSDVSLTACSQVSFASFTEPTDVAISPDGLNAYAADFVNDSVDVFSRNPSTGALTQLAGTAACVGELGAPCTSGFGLHAASAVVVSPDGANVYVTSQGTGGDDAAIAEFARDPATGALTQLTGANACIADASVTGCTTTSATGIGGPTSIEISPDGTSVYVVGQYSQAVAVFSRDPSTGDLTQLASPYDCVTSEVSGCGTSNVPGLEDAQSVTVSPDGGNVYVAAGGGSSAGDIVEFTRTQGNATPPPPAGAITDIDCIASSNATGCGTTDALDVNGPSGIAVSPDGMSVYVTSEQNETLLEFSRDPNSGDLGQLASPNSCITSQEVGCDTNNHATGLDGAQDVAVSPDGQSVYVTGTAANAVAAFSRDPNSGDLTQLASPADCITSNASGCGTTSANAITDPGSLVVSPENGDVYVASPDGGSSALVALARAPVAQPTGALTQLLEPNNCVGVPGGLAAHVGGSVPFGSVGCDTLLTSGDPSQSTVDVAVSPDGKSAYEVLNDNELAEFSRDATTGALTEIGCVSDAAPTGCTSAQVGMDSPTAVAVSSDGKNVYVTGGADNAVAEFSRTTSGVNTGLLTQLGGTGACVGETGGGGSCTNDVGYGLDNPTGIAVTFNGDDVYVTGAGDNAVAELARDPSTGALTPLSAPNACLSDGTVMPSSQCTNTSVGLGLDTPNTNAEADLAISLDSANVYVSVGNFGDDGDIAELHRNNTTGALSQLASPNDCVTSDAADTGCSTDNAVDVDGPEQIAIDPDGQNVYAADLGASAVLEFDRNPASGALTQLASPNSCIGGGGCPSSANGLTIDLGVAISPDGYNVYGTGADENAIAVLDRDPTTGILTQPAFPYDCLSSLYDSPTGCGTVNSAGFAGGVHVTVSPDGANVYEAAQSLPGLVELARQTPAADLGVSEAGAPGSATVGGQITATYTVTNHGPTLSDDAVLTVPLASELTLSSATPSQGSCSGTRTVACDLGELANGASATVAITLDLASIGSASDTATVSYTNDPNVANDSVTTTTAITAPAEAPPAPPAGPAVAPPVLTKSTDVQPVSGTILVRLPGSSTFVPLSVAENIPMGSTIDATHGTVAITVALPDGTTETGDFYDGEFVVTQDATGRVFETLTGGSFVGCPVSGKSQKHKKGKAGKKGVLEVAAAKKKSSTVVRQLWGNAHGNFTTKGRYGSAAVSGTIWLTQDRCDGTYFKVTKDTITVVAFAHPSKKHNLKQGQSILIPKP